MRSSTLSVVGAAPEAFGIFGFVAMLRSPEDGGTFVAVGAAGVVAAGAFACVLACCSAVRANLSASLSLVLLPHALSRSAVAASAARIRIVFIVMVGAPLGPCFPPRERSAARAGCEGYELAPEARVASRRARKPERHRSTDPDRSAFQGARCAGAGDGDLTPPPRPLPGTRGGSAGVLLFVSGGGRI